MYVGILNHLCHHLNNIYIIKLRWLLRSLDGWKIHNSQSQSAKNEGSVNLRVKIIYRMGRGGGHKCSWILLQPTACLLFVININWSNWVIVWVYIFIVKKVLKWEMMVSQMSGSKLKSTAKCSSNKVLVAFTSGRVSKCFKPNYGERTSHSKAHLFGENGWAIG